MNRVHRIGSITLGLTLMFFGIMFLAHMLIPAIPYSIIQYCWPLVFISLGIEVLFSTFGVSKVPVVYDKAGIFITALLVVFAMGMAGVSMCMEYAVHHMI